MVDELRNVASVLHCKKYMHKSLIKRITREDKIADGINREFAYLVDDVVDEVSTGVRFGAVGFELGELLLLSSTTLGHDDAEPPKCTV